MASFFHFGRSTDDWEADYFIFVGSKTKFLLSKGLIKHVPSSVLESIDTNRAYWFAFNQQHDWFSFCNGSSQRLGATKASWSTTLNPALREFLSDNRVWSPRTVFGPDGTCLTWTLKQPDRMGATRTCGRWLDSAQKAEMDFILKNEWTGRSTIPISFAALGVRGTFFIQFDDGSPARYDFRRYYRSLAEYMTRRRCHVMFLALHPQDPNQYFLIETNGNIRARVSPRIYAELRPALEKERLYNRVEIDVATVTPTRLVSYRVAEMRHTYSYP